MRRGQDGPGQGELTRGWAWVMVALLGIAAAADIAITVVMVTRDLPRWIAVPVVAYGAVLLGVVVKARLLIPERRQRR